MSYATTAQIQALIGPYTLGTDTRLTLTQVESVRDMISAEVEVYLAGAGVSVPVTTPTAFVTWLGLVNAYGAASSILKSNWPDTIGQGEQPAWKFWEERYQSSLKGIKDGSLLPPNLVMSGDEALAPSTYFTRNPDEEEDLGDIAEPVFKMGKVF